MNKDLVSLIEDYNGVTADQVLEFVFNPVGQVAELRVGKDTLPKQDVDQLISEANMFKETFLWRLLTARLEHIAQIKSVKAVDEDRLIFPKAVIFTVQQMEEVVNRLSNLGEKSKTEFNGIMKKKNKKKKK